MFFPYSYLNIQQTPASPNAKQGLFLQSEPVTEYPLPAAFRYSLNHFAISHPMAAPSRFSITSSTSQKPRRVNS